MPSKPKTLTAGAIATLLASAALILSGFGARSAADSAGEPAAKTTAHRTDPWIAAEASRLAADYDRRYREARKLDVAPKRPATAGRIGLAELRAEVAGLRERVRDAERKRRGPERSRFGTPESVGVPEGALEAIAACESGGNPAAVSAGGEYRGKYQFSYSTWASVGGSGDPAAAPVAEQDYRAALLYARAGSSPWPVCG